MIKVTTVIGPAWMAPYLVGDYAPDNEDDRKAIEHFKATHLSPDEYIVDIVRDENSEAYDVWFTWSYRLHGGDADGGNVFEYVVHSESE